MSSILSDRDVTDAERGAIADEPRPGVWVEEHVILTAEQAKGAAIVDRRGDGRTLDQAQTDGAIAGALARSAAPEEAEFVIRTVIASFKGGEKIDGKQYATDQRGGIHSDPLVRLLAFRAWGDRDRTWRKRDTARALLAGQRGEQIDALRRIYGFDGVLVRAVGFYEAQRGDRQASVMLRSFTADGMLDAFEELDAALSAGGEPVPSGPLTFDISSPAT